MDTVASKPEEGSSGLLAPISRTLPPILLAVAVGLVVLTVTISVVMDDSGAWVDATAAAGIAATVIAAAVMLGTAQGWANGRRMSLASVSTAIVGLGALALVVVTYVGGARDAGMPNAAIVIEGPATSAPAVVSDEGAALTEQISNNEIQPPGYAHDVGEQPTIQQFLDFDNASILRNVPGGTVLPNEVDALRDELAAAREFALEHTTVEEARAAGYRNTTNDVPFMGAHFLNSRYLMDGVFDPAKPEGLLFSKLGDPEGEWQLVGVWYLLIPGQGGATIDTPPVGFTSGLDLWHAHYGLCTRRGVISENNTAESCAADGGNFVGDLRWMMHAWVYPESGVDNSEGVFVYLNNDLYEFQSLVQAPIVD